MADALAVRAPQPRDAAARAHTGADRAAVGTQPPDAGLLVYGDQVAETHRPQDGVVIRAHELAVFPYGHRGGDALIAGAGHDDHRHLAAVHPCVRAGGRPCPRLCRPVLTALQQGGADVGAPAVSQPLGGDGGVLLDLPPHGGAYVVQRYCFCECDDVLYVEDGFVLQVVLGVAGDGQLPQDISVPLHVDDVRVVVGHPHAGVVPLPPAGELDVQQTRRFGTGHADVGAVQIRLDGSHIRLRHVGDDLKLCVGVAGHYAHGDGGVDAPASSCVGDDHGLHILQDVPADLSQDLFRFSAQHLAQFCGTVRDGDGLCTPCGQQELLLQYRRVGGDLRVVQHHTFSFVQLLYSIGPLAG